MTQINRKAELMEAAMQIVAEHGLADFSMRQVTNRVGVSEALLYKYFITKDKLLCDCYVEVDKRVAACFAEDMPSMRQPEVAMRLVLDKYIRFFVSNGYRTIFYSEFRRSKYVKFVVEHSKEADATYFSRFTELCVKADKKYHITQKIDENILWTYLIDGCCLFATRLIRGELPQTEETYSSICKLLTSGTIGIINEPYSEASVAGTAANSIQSS